VRPPWVALALVLAVAAGCSLTGDVSFGSGSCEDVPSGVCNAQMQAAANAVGGQVTDVAIRCAPGIACTRAHGSGTATVTRADGTKVTRAWSYVGDPGPPPVPACNGIAVDLCQREVNSLIDDVSITKHLVGITVTCQGHCDEGAGTIQVEYRFGDGSRETTTSGWSSGSGTQP